MVEPSHEPVDNGRARPGRTTTTALPEVLAEILKRIDDVYNKQGTQITRVQEEMISWREVNERLTQLLHTKSQVTEEVSSSYMKLAEHLVKFSSYLVQSEITLSRVEQPLLNLTKTLPSLTNGSLTEGMKPLQMQELQQAIAEIKTANQEMQGGLKQTLRQMYQGAIAPGQPKNGTSILTDLANWKAGLFWFGMGSVFVAGMMYVVFRGSGFQQATRAVNLQGQMIEARLERIEIWLGIQGVDDETPEFEEQPIPEE
jgi:hypothetical protein